MVAYIIRRLFAAALTLLVVTFVTFGIFFMIPKLTGSDPAALFTGKLADERAIEGIRVKLGLDQPIYVQYWRFLKGLVFGRDYDNGPDITHCAAPCFGYSFRTDQEIWPLLLDRLPVTMTLAAGAALIWIVFGISSGLVSALRKGTIEDRGLMVTALAGVSLPIYFTGLLATLIFVYQLQWLPAINTDLTFAEDPGTWFLHDAAAVDRRWRSSTPPRTPDIRERACWRPWARTTCAPRGPRACGSVRSSASTRCVPALRRSSRSSASISARCWAARS